MIFVILHNIRSVHNVASIFRTADGAGVDKIYLTGYTPAPVDRFGRPRQDFHKVALGAEESVEWERDDILQLTGRLRDEGAQVVAVEQAPEAVDYREFDSIGDAVFVFGNEVDGLPKDVLEACDEIIEIPMRGQKESLNVSVAAGIVLFSVLNG